MRTANGAEVPVGQAFEPARSAGWKARATREQVAPRSAAKLYPISTLAQTMHPQFLVPLCAALAAGAVMLPSRAAPQQPDLGANAALHGWRPFPDDNPWNQTVDRLPVDPASAALIERTGPAAPLHPDFGVGLNGIPYVVTPGSQPKVPITFEYRDESDPGPYPVPPDAPIEGGRQAKEGDRHILVVDRDKKKLYELFAAVPDGKGYRAGSGAVFDLTSNALRPAGWTSADAAGLPIFPGLVKYDEVGVRKAVRHALRFTVQRTRRAYVSPARHFAGRSDDPLLPPMGMRVRLRGDYDLSSFPPQARVVLQALKTYGMLLADNGSNWFISGSPDPRWNNDDLHAITRVKGRDLEVVRMGPLMH